MGTGSWGKEGLGETRLVRGLGLGGCVRVRGDADKCTLLRLCVAEHSAFTDVACAQSDGLVALPVAASVPQCTAHPMPKATRDADEATLPLKAIATNLFPLPASLPSTGSAPRSKHGSTRTAPTADVSTSARPFGGRRYVRRKPRTSDTPVDGDSKSESKHPGLGSRGAPRLGLPGGKDASHGGAGTAPRIRPTTPTRGGGASRRSRLRASRLPDASRGSETKVADAVDVASPGSRQSPAPSHPRWRPRGGRSPQNVNSPLVPALESDGERKHGHPTRSARAGSGDSQLLPDGIGSLSPIADAPSPSCEPAPGFRSRRIVARRRAPKSSLSAGVSVSPAFEEEGKRLSPLSDRSSPGGKEGDGDHDEQDGKMSDGAGTHVKARARSLLRQRLDERLAVPDGSPLPHGPATAARHGTDGGESRRTTIVTGHGDRCVAAVASPSPLARPVAVHGGNQLYRGALRNLFPDGPELSATQRSDGTTVDVASPDPAMGGTGRTAGSSSTGVATPASLRSLADLMFSPSMREAPAKTAPSVPQAPSKRADAEGPAAQASLMAATGTLVFS